MAIVDDFVADIDRRPEFFQSNFDNINGALNTGAKTPNLSE
jgi:hypothetical protein